MTWYQTLSWPDFFFGALFLLLYGGYIYRIKKTAAYFKQSANTIWLKFGLRSTYFLLLFLALLGPSFGAMTKEIKTSGKDILILMDLSASMNTRDINPSRLERAKFELAQIIPELDADRLGMIVFAGEAEVQCPLTFDQEALLLYNQLLNTTQAPGSGTDYRPALELAWQKFEKKTGSDSLRSRLILLISDGENFGDEVRTTLKRLRQNQIPVFTLGIGTDTGDQIPVGRSFKKDRNGKKVISRLNPESLLQLARLTDGQYFEITEKQNETPRLVRAINLVSGEARETQLVDITANKYIYPLLFALFLIVADILITVNVIKI